MIHIQNLSSTTKMLIENSIDQREDIELFLNEINNINKKISYEITFIDVKSLPLMVVKGLIKRKDRLTVETTQKSLWIYLSKFGIVNSYKNILIDKKIKIKKPINAIAIGGSAGSIEGLVPIIKSLPYVDISVFIIIHILPNKKSVLAQLLENETNYKVFEAKDNMKVKKNCIYIAPPDFHMECENGFIKLDQSDHFNYARPSIDVSFHSLSKQYKDSLLAILLCGYMDDGTKSLKYLKKNSSTIIVQDPNECEAADIPLNAIITKAYCKILSINQIIDYIKAILVVDIDIRDELNNFLDKLFTIYGYDFRSYDKGSLSRRIELTMQSYGVDNFKQFEQAIFEDDEMFDKLLREFSINVTSFFRNPLMYKSLRENVLTTLNSYPSIRVWCAGCSRGDEPYSVAIMLDEAGLLNKSQIYATDFNSTILNEAVNGLYPKDEYEKFKLNYTQSGGKKDFDDWFDVQDTYIEVNKKIHDKVLFFKHNLVTDGSINEFNLIFCRNVLIYFDKALQKRVFRTIDESLARNGFLVLGESEMSNDKYDYNIIDENRFKIYRKRNKI